MPSNAKQRQATPSNAKQRQATPSQARNKIFLNSQDICEKFK
jgi:hypothetical protein